MPFHPDESAIHRVRGEEHPQRYASLTDTKEESNNPPSSSEENPNEEMLRILQHLQAAKNGHQHANHSGATCQSFASRQWRARSL